MVKMKMLIYIFCELTETVWDTSTVSVILHISKKLSPTSHGDKLFFSHIKISQGLHM